MKMFSVLNKCKGLRKTCISTLIIIIQVHLTRGNIFSIILLLSNNESGVTMSLNTKDIKKENLQLVRSFLQNSRIHTKNDIAKATNLSKASCYNILKELILTNEVVEISLANPKGGRPARRFQYNDTFSLLLHINFSIDKGVRKILYSVSTVNNNQLYREEYETKEIHIDNICHKIKSIQRAHKNIKVLSMSVPGIVQDNNIIDCDIVELAQSNMYQKIVDTSSLTPFIYNDVNVATNYYYKKFESQNPEVLAYIYFPNQALPGMGTIVNGRLLRGHTNISGEIKYLYPDISSSTQLSYQESPLNFVPYLMKTIQSITSILNPQFLILSGDIFTEQVQKEISTQCNTRTINQHLPTILYHNEFHTAVMAGLHILSMDTLNTILKGV